MDAHCKQKEMAGLVEGLVRQHGCRCACGRPSLTHVMRVPCVVAEAPTLPQLVPKCKKCLRNVTALSYRWGGVPHPATPRVVVHCENCTAVSNPGPSVENLLPPGEYWVDTFRGASDMASIRFAREYYQTCSSRLSLEEWGDCTTTKGSCDTAVNASLLFDGERGEHRCRKCVNRFECKWTKLALLSILLVLTRILFLPGLLIGSLLNLISSVFAFIAFAIRFALIPAVLILAVSFYCTACWCLCFCKLCKCGGDDDDGLFSADNSETNFPGERIIHHNVILISSVLNFIDWPALAISFLARTVRSICIAPVSLISNQIIRLQRSQMSPVSRSRFWLAVEDLYAPCTAAMDCRGHIHRCGFLKSWIIKSSHSLLDRYTQGSKILKGTTLLDASDLPYVLPEIFGSQLAYLAPAKILPKATNPLLWCHRLSLNVETPVKLSTGRLPVTIVGGFCAFAQTQESVTKMLLFGAPAYLVARTAAGLCNSCQFDDDDGKSLEVKQDIVLCDKTPLSTVLVKYARQKTLLVIVSCMCSLWGGKSVAFFQKGQL